MSRFILLCPQLRYDIVCMEEKMPEKFPAFVFYRGTMRWLDLKKVRPHSPGV